ncbi:MAG: DUF4340 domain-containing protein [Saprospiraceae bacterium]
MKKNVILLAVLICLGLLAYFLVNKSNAGKVISADRLFAYPKEKVKKISVEKVGKPIQNFELKNGNWYINNKYKIENHTIRHMLDAISNVTIQNIPSNKAKATILKDMKTDGISVKIYDNSSKAVRAYTIGTKAHDDKGTAYLVSGQTQPYNMYIKGFDGDLRARFYHKIDDWRSKEIFAYNPKEIEEIIVDFNKNNEHSFRITKHKGQYDVNPLNQYIKKSKRPLSQDVIRGYVSLFDKVYGESFDNDNLHKENIERNNSPFATISVTAKGKTKTIELFPFRDILLEGVSTKDIEEIEQIERHFVKINKNEDLMIAQNRLIKPLLRPYSIFHPY